MTVALFMIFVSYFANAHEPVTGGETGDEAVALIREVR